MNTIPTTLLDQLRHPDHNERKQAVFALASIDHPERLSVLIDALQAESDPMVREDMTFVIARHGEDAIAHLIPLLHADQPQVRNQSAHVLGKIGDERAVTALVAALQDDDPAVVGKAAFALHQIGDVQAIPALVNLLGHPDAEVQTMLTMVLSHFGEAAIAGLAAALDSTRWEVREQAVEILGQIAHADAVPILVNALNDSDWQVRFASLTALADQEGVPQATVQAMTDDPDGRVQKLARHLLQVM